MEATILGVNKLGIACEKIMSTVGCTYNGLRTSVQSPSFISPTAVHIRIEDLVRDTYVSRPPPTHHVLDGTESSFLRREIKGLEAKGGRG